MYDLVITFDPNAHPLLAYSTEHRFSTYRAESADVLFRMVFGIAA